MNYDLPRRGDGSLDMDAHMRVCDVIGKSGVFRVACKEEVFVKTLAGASIGLDPVSSMMGIDMIQGNMTLSAAMTAAAIDRHPGYAIQILRMDNQSCDIAFYAGKIGVHGVPFRGTWSPGEKPWAGLKDGVNFKGVESFTMEDAKVAGLTGKGSWKTYPRQMLRNRAITEGQRAFAPDLTGCGKVYTQEELGGNPRPDDGDRIRRG
jgi:hypothetical protein